MDLKNLKKPAAILFDWDGTLVDSMGLICVSMEKAFNEVKMPVPEELARKILSHTFMEEHLPETRRDEMKKIYRNHYHNLAEEGLDALPYSEQSLKAIQKHGIKMAVVSNKLKDYVAKEVKKLRWENYFVSIIGSGSVAEDKPSPLPALKALQDIGIKPSENVWFMGDTATDMATAYNSGCLPVFFGEDDHTSVYYAHCRPKAHFPNHRALVEFFAQLK